MAEEVRCDGCGAREDATKPEKMRQIVPCRIGWSFDSRWASELESHDADLCPTCRGTLLHEYFAVPAKGKLEVPGFAGPTEKLRALPELTR